MLVPQAAYDRYEQFSVYEYTLNENVAIELWGYTRTDNNGEEIRLALIKLKRVVRIASRMTVCSEEDYLA